jgi:hypothetical protein
LLPIQRRVSEFLGLEVDICAYAKVYGRKSSVSRDVAGLADLVRLRAV